jgi:lipopolysaccharide transport system permease protein
MRRNDPSTLVQRANRVTNSTADTSLIDHPGAAASVTLNEVLIEPSRGWPSLKLKELWEYRELLYFLAWRDIKLRYKQTALGVAWAVLQPLSTMLLFWLLFGRLAGIKSDGIPYPIFAFSALMFWTFFANAITNSSNSLVGNSHLITKVYFPRMIIPIAAVGAGLLDLLISFPLLVVMGIYYSIDLRWTILMVPVLVLMTVFLAVGVGMLLSALNVKYRDVRHALPFVVQLWLFATPIIYPTSMLPERWRWLLRLNPLTGIIEAFRASLFGGELDWAALGISASLTIALLLYSVYSFRRVEKRFADIV